MNRNEVAGLLISLKSWKTTIKMRALNTTIRPPCWKYIKSQWCFYALFGWCRPGPHILIIKKFSYNLFSRLQSARRETIKTKKQREKGNKLFTHNRKVALKNQLIGEPKFSLKIYCQKQIAIMTHCIRNQRTKRHFFALDRKRVKKIKRSTGKNLNRNAEAVSWGLSVKKEFLKNFIIFTGRHMCRSPSFDKSL